MSGVQSCDLPISHHPRLAAIRGQVDRDVRDALTAWLEHAACPHAGAAADAVIALGDGLALRMLYDPDDHESLLDALDRTLDALIP
ncbi:TetR family transcriptional regulator C-terminal domain-containing protein [Streptomyces toxytricini]|uniref:TetR family transcriptional regulator C-terminal domain-containing protein n=1 Tax=Streptomyces toxytricini TaxID=67369 RepID=UPI00343E4508